jgi:RimJ/RimL family protein N-acetyltransferase
MNLTALVTAAPTLALRGAKVSVRRFTAADIPMVVAQENDRAIMRWIRDPQPAADVQARAEAMAAPWRGADGEWLACTVVPHATATPAGIVVCRVTVAAHQTMEFGYRLSQDVHRRGFGFEACVLLCDHLFTQVGVHKLVAYCVADNEPSWRLMAKLGMQREARLREYTHLDGAWRDEFVYGLLAREWRRPAGSAGSQVSGTPPDCS